MARVTIGDLINALEAYVDLDSGNNSELEECSTTADAVYIVKSCSTGEILAVCSHPVVADNFVARMVDRELRIEKHQVYRGAEPLANIDWSPLLSISREYINAKFDNSVYVDEIDSYACIAKTALKAIYGKDIHDRLPKQQ